MPDDTAAERVAEYLRTGPGLSNERLAWIRSEVGDYAVTCSMAGDETARAICDDIVAAIEELLKRREQERSNVR